MSGRGRMPLSLAGALMVLALLVAAAPATAQETKGPALLADARSGHSATLLEDERVLIVGGVDDEAELASIEVVDPATATVEPLGTLAQARTGHSATLLPDGRILITGGWADGSSLSAAELFDPATGISESAGALAWARTGHAAALLDDGRVVLVGGTALGKPVARAEIYDPTSDSFTPAAKSKATHRSATATVLANGQVLVTGKATKKKAPAAELYDPARDKWVALKKAPALTGHVAAKLRDGRVLLVGGSAKKGQQFDPAKGKFAPAPALAGERKNHTATLLSSGEVLIVGGEHAGAEVAAIESIDIEGDSFQTTGEMMTPRTGHTTTALSDGRAAVIGGTWAGLALDDVLIYDPGTQELEPLGGAGTFVEPNADARTRAEVQAELGPPHAFVTLYPDRTEPVSAEPLDIQTWTYYDTGTEFTFEGGLLVGEASIESLGEVLATPYDPGLFEAYVTLDEVLAAAGIEEYFGGPMDDAETTRLYFAEQLAWGLKDGALHFIEGIALAPEEAE